MRFLLSLTAVLTAASLASAQMPLPAFGSTFTSTLTRGFWFQAPTNFLITGLSVPNEAGQANQVVEVINLGAAPPAFPGTVVGTQLFYDNSTAAASIIPCAIQVLAGDYIGILGACTPTVGSTTSYNSYGTPAGAYVSDILGLPTTITRLGTQFGIGAGGNNPVWEEPGGALARVEVYVSPLGGGTVATNTTYGAACGGSAIGDGSFYELFDGANPIDIANTSYTMSWTGSDYVVVPGATT